MSARGTDAAADAVTRLTGHAVVRTRPLGSVTRATLDDGREVVAKTAAPTALAAEAAGLRWLAVPDGPGVPEVLGVDESWLVSEVVGEGGAGRRGTAAAAFGRGLAALHAAGASAFGSPPPGGPTDAWIGDAPMRNDPAPPGTHWIDWYVEARVLPYVRLAVDRGGMSSSQAAQVEQGCARLADADVGPDGPPARLHGDLWTGNVLWGDDRGWVIDPAAHGGHRETDLAMLALFGCPQLDTVLAAYDEAAPLAEGWRGRVGLHQLFPLLVHAALFGGGYASSACERISSL